jgi:transcriptional regulator with GAF, ATPase, and Fis domain
MRHGYLQTVVRDISERKRSEAALVKAFKEIQTLKDQLQTENIVLRDEVDRASMFEEIVGTSMALQTVLSPIAKLAPTDSTVFITGETGTSKELMFTKVPKVWTRIRQRELCCACAIADFLGVIRP